MMTNSPPPPAGFVVWNANVPQELSNWIDAWNRWPAREVSAHPSYLGLFAANDDEILCASYRAPDGGEVIYPFLRRDLSSLAGGDLVSDITTPYGYGGPAYWDVRDMDSVSGPFWDQFDRWATKTGIVSEFIRFDLLGEGHPTYPGERVERSINVVRSLELDDEQMWMSFEQKVRKNVKKAERSGVSITVDETGSQIADFRRLYAGTMERRDAATGYYFPPEFFEAIHRDLPGQFAYFHAHLDDIIISTELVLVSQNTVYSFLGGTDSSTFDHRPNDLLKHAIIRWARDKGKTNFVLGGGASPGDGIERYKKAFAPHGSIDFVTGQRVFIPEIYEQLVKARRLEVERAGRAWPGSSDFFPAYRMPGDAG
jgi:hypothetical protein